ncbi:hypothetical protein HNQ71_005463 [Mesorhizobium sangaii]|uniref:Uncharacterized protein n=1 Tax=Mesorhizobium sangaii TaxID=505389 RepID=A0A841PFY8_9HYPH|nr:hypothetical protein [Mesorhizobium sangaii]
MRLARDLAMLQWTCVEAATGGWTVVDMKADWAEVFSFEP